MYVMWNVWNGRRTMDDERHTATSARQSNGNRAAQQQQPHTGPNSNYCSYFLLSKFKFLNTENVSESIRLHNIMIHPIHNAPAFCIVKSTTLVQHAQSTTSFPSVYEYLNECFDSNFILQSYVEKSLCFAQSGLPLYCHRSVHTIIYFVHKIMVTGRMDDLMDTYRLCGISNHSSNDCEIIAIDGGGSVSFVLALGQFRNVYSFRFCASWRFECDDRLKITFSIKRVECHGSSLQSTKTEIALATEFFRRKTSKWPITVILSR